PQGDGGQGPGARGRQAAIRGARDVPGGVLRPRGLRLNLWCSAQSGAGVELELREPRPADRPGDGTRMRPLHLRDVPATLRERPGGLVGDDVEVVLGAPGVVVMALGPLNLHGLLLEVPGRAAGPVEELPAEDAVGPGPEQSLAQHGDLAVVHA